MLFCSKAYVAFFAVIFIAYWMMGWILRLSPHHRKDLAYHTQQVRIWLLLAASFFFYASWNHWLACLIGVSTFVDYWLARGMDAGYSPRVRKIFLTTSILANVSLLCYFKYVNFFLGSLETALHAAGASASIPLLQVILPVGISFYTFEAINYGVDVYRKRVPAERNLAHLMLFITFFPHLVAGPIVRAKDFLPQIKRPKRWDWARINLGVQYFLMGLVKKIVIADRMSYFVDPIYAQPEAYSSHHLWIAVFAYSLQVYGDFSGYSDMAIGSAHMLGYKLAPNFNMPYLSGSMAEMWNRWHISLSSWLRDYVFNPLGGARGKPWLVRRNLFLTMFASGVWHGANWTFVLWGSAHGLLMVLHHWFHSFSKKRRWLQNGLQSTLGAGLCVILTFTTWSILAVLFRSPSLATAGTMYHHMFVPYQGWESSPFHLSNLIYTGLFMALCHWIALQKWFRMATLRIPEPAMAFGYAWLLTIVLVLAPGDASPFIYFQF